MIRLSRAIVLTAASLAFGSAVQSASARAGGAPTVAVIARHLDLHPQTEQAARATLARLGDAALEACGAPAASLHEVTQSIRGSACWRESMAEVTDRIADPLLRAVYAKSAAGHRTAARATPDGGRLHAAGGSAADAPRWGGRE